MKLIHCADLHLDARMEASLSREKARERRQEVMRTFTRMVEAAEDQGVEAILLCGDLFDAKTISARAGNCVLDAVKNHPQIYFYYLQGNHDQNTFLADLEAMPDNFRTFGPEWTTYRQGDVCISGAEFSESTAGGLFQHLNLEPERINLVMLHGTAAEYGMKDQADGFSLRALRGKHIDYLALGHIHSYRTGRLDDRGIWCYSGCLEGRGFDECGEKGYVLLETADLQVRHTFVPFAYRQCWEVPVEITGLLTQEEIRIKIQEALKTVPEKDLVKVVLTGEALPETEKDPAWIEKWLEDSRYFLKVQDRTSLAVRPEDYRYDISLKGEFVRMVMASDLTQEEKDQVLRIGIRALVGED